MPKAKTTNCLVPLDTSWFDKDPHMYLSRDDFKGFQELAGVNFRNLLSNDVEKVRATQRELCRKSCLFNEINKLHFGYGFPFLVYTHGLDLFEKVPDHDLEIDKILLSFDMCDSLRRRHIAVSCGLLPQTIADLSHSLEKPLIIKNLGCGVGLDSINAATKLDGAVGKVLNYDTDPECVLLGKRLTQHLEQRGALKKGVINYIPKNFIKSAEPADLIIKIGIICGLRDDAAKMLLARDFMQLSRGGKLIISSSNTNMQSSDPLASFLIQHIGTRDNPFKGWGLNYRTKDRMREIIDAAGFKRIEIYTDADFPGKESMPAEILYGIDNLPATVLNHAHCRQPLSLPSKEILDRKVGYNWIAVATK
jgi:hypothetical protein